MPSVCKEMMSEWNIGGIYLIRCIMRIDTFILYSDSLIFISDKMIEILFFSTCLILTTTLFLRWNPKKQLKDQTKQTKDRRHLGNIEHAMMNAGSQGQTKDRRALGNIEQVMLDAGREGHLVIVRTAIISSKRPISLKSLQIAMICLAERHPLLRLKVKRSISSDMDNDWFIPMDKMEVKVDELPNKLWMDVMEQQLSESAINVEEGPLWHVKFLPNINREDTHVKLPHQCALVFVFDHAICDDNSLLRLINETLLCLEDEMNGVKKYDTIESLPLPESLCDLTGVVNAPPLSPKPFQLLISWLSSSIGRIVAGLKAKDNFEWIKKINNNFIPPAVIPATNMIPMAFNRSETRQLMKACKSHNVSPFAAFQAALLTIINNKLNLSEAEFKITVNLRPFYAKSKADNIYQQVVSYATFIPCETKIPETKKTSGFWTLAEYFKYAVHDKLKGRVDESLHLFSASRHSKISVDVPVSEAKTITSIAIFHNLGNCSFMDRKDDCPVRVISTYGCVPQHLDSNSLFHAHCVYFENIFLYSLCYSTDTISKNAALKIAEDLKQKIIEEISYKDG